jgi:hypothetical protein
MPTPQRAAGPGDEEGPRDLAMSALLRQLAHELGALQLMAADMESSVDEMIERHARMLDARSIQNLQLLDIVNQTLLALAAFAENAAALSPPEWKIDGKAATAGLKLASLAQRLARGGGNAGRTPADAYELFSDG